MADELQNLTGDKIKPRSTAPMTNINASSSSSSNTLKDNDEDKLHKEVAPTLHLTKTDAYVFISILISFFLYILSLEGGCQNTQTYCLVNLSPGFFYLLGLYLSICSIIISLTVLMTLEQKINAFHLAYSIPIYIYLLYYYDQGSDLSHHGSYNKTIFYCLLVFFTIIILIIKFLIYLKRSKCFKMLLCIFLSVVLLIAYMNYKLRSGCNKWMNALNGKRVTNNPKLNKCYIIQPSKCWVNLIDGIFDVSWMIQEDCNKFRTGERQELIKYLPERLKDTFNFAYPITTNYTWLNQSHFDRFANNVMNDIIDLDKDDYYSRSDKPEVYLKFNPVSQFGKVEMNVQRKEALVKEREKIYDSLKDNEKPRYKNFLFVYIDALSRAHFMRKMKYTKEFLMNYFNNKDETITAYQMMKYHAFIFFTPPNVNPMFYGESMFNSNGTHIIRAFKEKGFITGQSNNICSRELYDLEDDYTKDMDFEAYDHENIALFCDPNFHNAENPFTPYLGPYSIKRRCLYGRDTFDYVLDYGEKFWDAYKDDRKFLRVAFQDAHEGTGEVVKYLDERLRVFLDSFLSKGYLNDTAVFFVSDHGNNMIGFYNIFQVEDFVMEKTLASWYILLPKLPEEKELNSIRKNEQVMVTPYDIHDTMLDILRYDKESEYYSRYGQSIYYDVDGLNRDCLNYTLDLKKEWCRCYDYN